MNSRTMRVPAALAILFSCIWLQSAQAATITVHSANDSGPGTLRQAVLDATAGDEINISASIATITLASNIQISKNLKIVGNGADATTISGGGSAQLFHVNSGVAQLVRLRLDDGRGGEESWVNGGLTYLGGGAVFHDGGTLTIRDCEITNNSSAAGNGSTSFDYGGAIFARGTGTLNLRRCLFSGNSVAGTGSVGGGAVNIFGSVIVNIKNCTFHDNTSPAEGGGIRIETIPSPSFPDINVVNSTFFDNSGTGSTLAEDIHKLGNGGSLAVQNNIFNRSSGSGIRTLVFSGSGTKTSLGGNIFRDSPGIQTIAGDDILGGNSSAGLSGILSANGGGVRTIAISSSASLATGFGTTGFGEPGLDSRRFKRNDRAIDAGAYEFGAAFSYLTLTPNDNTSLVATTANLSITFAHNTTVSSGTVTIRRSSDDAVVQTIASSQVSGSGSKVITIDPPVDFASNTELYVQIPGPLFTGPNSSTWAGISDKTEWNFSTGVLPNLPPIIGTTNTMATMFASQSINIYVSVSDPITVTSGLVLTASSSDVSLVPTSHIVQVGLTSATTCFSVSAANVSAQGEVTIEFTVRDPDGAVATTSISVNIRPDLPTKFAFDMEAGNKNRGWNQGGAGGFSDRFFIRVGPNANRESEEITVTSGTFNVFNVLSAPEYIVKTEYAKQSDSNQQIVSDGSLPATATFGPGVASTTNTLRITYTRRRSRNRLLFLRHFEFGGAQILSSTVVTIRVVLPPAVQLGLSATTGNTSGATGAGIGIDGFNNGVTALIPGTSINTRVTSYDAANYPTAVANDVKNLFFVTETVSATSDNPAVVISGKTGFTLTVLESSDAGLMDIAYSGKRSTTANITFAHDGGGYLRSTTVSVVVLGDARFLAFSTQNTTALDQINNGDLTVNSDEFVDVNFGTFSDEIYLRYTSSSVWLTNPQRYGQATLRILDSPATPDPSIKPTLIDQSGDWAGGPEFSATHAVIHLSSTNSLRTGALKFDWRGEAATTFTLQLSAGGGIQEGLGTLSTTEVTVTINPLPPIQLAFSTSSSASNDGFNSGDASGLGNRLVVQVGANERRESPDINVAIGTFNALNNLSPVTINSVTQFNLEGGFGPASLSGTAPTLSVSSATTIATFRLGFPGRFAQTFDLTLSTLAGSHAGLASTSVTLNILIPPAVQLGLTSTFGNTTLATGKGVCIDGFNGGVTEFSGTTTVSVMLASLDAANYIAATGNSTFPLAFVSTTITASVDNPDFALSGPGGALTLASNLAVTSGDLTITYSGVGVTSAVITFTQLNGSMSSTSVTLTITPRKPVISTSNAFITMLEDQSTQLYVSVFDHQHVTSLVVLTGTSSDVSLIANDGIVQASGATTAITCFSVTGASTNTNGTVNITITGTNPDTQSNSTSFSVVIVPVNDIPSFIAGANVSVEVDSGFYDLPFAGAISDGDPETAQMLSFHLLVDNPALFSTQPTVSVSNGNLSFGVAPATSGIANVLISLSDDGGTDNGGINTTATQAFEIAVSSLNKAPVFSTGLNVIVTEDSGSYSAAFATGIDDGDPSTSQSLTFHVVATNSALFLQQPAISTTGELTFTPATNANGTSAVLVSLSDDGPNGGGNVNTSATQTFHITITPVNDAPTITQVGAVSIDENSTTTLSFSIADIDDPINTLQVTATSANLALVTNGGFSFSATQASMTMTVRPNCGAVGTLAIAVTVKDCGAPALTSTAVFQLTVSAAPSFVISGDLRPCPRVPVEYSMPATVGANYNWEVNNGILLGGQGTTIATVNWDSGTTGSILASVTTPAGCTFSSLIRVTTFNIAANTDYASTGTGASVTFNVLTNDLGNGLTLIGATQPAHGTLATSASGSITYTPDTGFEGFDTFNYTIRDDNSCLETGASVQVVVSTEVDRINLFYVERKKDRVGGVRGLRGARGTAVSPDGKHIYVAGQRDNSIAWFGRSLIDGSLTYVNRMRHNKGGVKSMRYPAALLVSPDGKHVYTSAFGSGAVVSFNRSSTGALTYLERKLNNTLDAGKQILGMGRPIDLTISLDGKTLYVLGYSDHSIVVFRRDVNSGRLQFIERHKDGQNNVDGMRYPLGLDVSADGRNLYVAGSGDNAVAVFKRNTSSGALTYRTRLKDGMGGVDGIADAADVIVSPDGKHVYVAGYGDEAIAAFERDIEGDGDLIFISDNDTGYLDGITALAAAPGGAHIFGAAELDDALVVLERDKVSGELKYLEALRDGVNGADGLQSARDISISSDGRHLYTAAHLDKAVAVAYRNRRPVAKEDTSTPVVKNTSLAVTVLNNDVEKDAGESLTITSKTDGALGSVTITGSGTTVTYAAGAVEGTDTFTYTIEDGKGGSSTATVTILVGALKSGQLTFNTAENAEQVLVQPNPIREVATIGLTGLDSQNLRVNLRDMSGRQVANLYNGAATDNVQFIWNTRSYELPTGAYILEIKRSMDNGVVQYLHQTVQIVR